MQDFTLDDLRRVMRTAVGVDDTVDLDGDITDTEFGEMGYDSLALMEIVSRIEKECGASVPDDTVPGLTTPGELIAYVNGQLTGAGAA